MYDGYKKYGNEEASSYEEERKKEAHWWQEDQYVADYFSRNQPNKILDAPVGTGRFLHHYINAEKIIGIDISEQMLAESTQKLSNQHLKNVCLQHADILKLDFLDNQFDLTICWRFAHLVPEELLGNALQELGRVTKGTILLQAYVAPPYWVRLLLALGRLPNKLIRPLTGSPSPPLPWSHIRSYSHTHKSILEKIANAGLLVQKKDEIARYGETRVCVYQLKKSPEQTLVT